MLRLMALAYFVAAAAAQQYYYCSAAGDSPVTVGEPDFYLVTRRATESAGYSSGLTCEFNAVSSTGAFFVEIQSFRVSTALFTISSDGRTLFSGSSIQGYQSSITTPSKSLQVRFDATGDHSSSEGVTLRVRALDFNGCPPGWAYLYGSCFGTSTTSDRLNIVDAQRACNSMRSNLLHVPTAHPGSIASFVRMLPVNLRSYFTWIGLTDLTSAGRYRHYWLNGLYQYSTSEISCVSGGSYLTCYSNERCGAIYDRTLSYAIYMDNCADRNNFACSMPPGGTSIFYTVPYINSIISPTYTTNTALIWGIVAGCVIFAALVAAGVYSRLRYSRVTRATGAASVVVSAGRVTIPPPSGSYPMQPQPHPQPPYPVYPTATQPAAGDLPTYEAAIGGGYGNAGYRK